MTESFATQWDMPAATHYDAAGNLVDDGLYRYAYDAWNRLVKVTRPGPSRRSAGGRRGFR